MHGERKREAHQQGEQAQHSGDDVSVLTLEFAGWLFAPIMLQAECGAERNRKTHGAKNNNRDSQDARAAEPTLERGPVHSDLRHTKGLTKCDIRWS